MSEKSRPNILLITTDQQRFDTVPPFKPSFLRVPHIEHLAREGVRFDCAYSDCPLCVPSRVGIMTGKNVYHHKMSKNGKTTSVIGNTDTLPAYLHECGYQTAAIGKMHFGPARTKHGFDKMLLPDDYYQEMRNSGNQLQPMRNGLGQNDIAPGMSTVPEALTHTAWVVEKSREYIFEHMNNSKPFFLWTSFSKPHPPFDPPEPYYSMYKDSPIPTPVCGEWVEENTPRAFERHMGRFAADIYTSSDELIRAARAAYYGLITQIDYNIGRLLAAIRETDDGTLDNTFIIFTSDHGEYLGDHKAISKTFHHEVSTHVPFIMKPDKSWDRKLYHKNSSKIVSHADILPTFINAANGKVPDDVDGIDLCESLEQRLSIRKYIDMLSGDSVESPLASIAITDGQWKYIWFPEGGHEQFFDLKNDRYETKNLAGKKSSQDKLKELKNELIKRHKNLSYGFVKKGKLVKMAVKNDQIDCKWKLYPWAPGYTTEYCEHDIKH